jgi:5-methylcytosine-specific restriction endonuclease McrA
MPARPSAPCRHPGCAALAASGDRYCPRHVGQQQTKHARYDATQRHADPRLAEAARIRSGVTWQKVRRLHRIREPLCCDPFGDHPDEPRPNQNSHHIEDLATRPDLAYDLENLAPTCTACHGKVERMVRAGQATRHLFARAAETAR